MSLVVETHFTAYHISNLKVQGYEVFFFADDPLIVAEFSKRRV